MSIEVKYDYFAPEYLVWTDKSAPSLFSLFKVRSVFKMYNIVRAREGIVRCLESSESILARIVNSTLFRI